MTEDTFPEVRWGSGPGFVGGAIDQRHYRLEVGCVFVRRLTPLDHRLLLQSSGRFTVFGPLGVPLLLLMTTPVYEMQTTTMTITAVAIRSTIYSAAQKAPLSDG